MIKNELKKLSHDELTKIETVYNTIIKLISIGVFYILLFLFIFLALNMHFVYTPDTFFLKEETKAKHDLKYKSVGEILKDYQSQANVIDTLSSKADSLTNVSEVYYNKFSEMFTYYQDEVKLLQEENELLTKQLSKCK